MMGGLVRSNRRVLIIWTLVCFRGFVPSLCLIGFSNAAAAADPVTTNQRRQRTMHCPPPPVNFIFGPSGTGTA
jgi:hypothetical protein